MDPESAKKTWMSILRHAHELSGKLERNVGLPMAACDYLSTIHALVKHPVLIEENELRNKEENASRDWLTGLFNRRYFHKELLKEAERFRRFGTPFSLLMADVDHFKRFNDQHGHPAGDTALKTVAEVLTRIARVYDKTVRYGGEEFAVILPQTDRKEAIIVAERIRETMEKRSIVHDGLPLGMLTLSIGVGAYPLDALDMADLVRRADQALYLAKCRRNCVAALLDYHRQHVHRQHIAYAAHAA